MSGSSEPGRLRMRGSSPSGAGCSGLDYGTRRIGIAVSDDEQRIASPLENYTRSRDEVDATRLKKSPRNTASWGWSSVCRFTRGAKRGKRPARPAASAAWAVGRDRAPLALWDERFTSAIAEDHLLAANLSKKKRKERLDKVAAQIMLQSFLESRRRPPK